MPICYLGVPLLDQGQCPIGHLFVMDDKPLADPQHAINIVNLFAARAGEVLSRKTSPCRPLKPPVTLAFLPRFVRRPFCLPGKGEGLFSLSPLFVSFLNVAICPQKTLFR